MKSIRLLRGAYTGRATGANQLPGIRKYATVYEDGIRHWIV